MAEYGFIIINTNYKVFILNEGILKACLNPTKYTFQSVLICYVSVVEKRF